MLSYLHLLSDLPLWVAVLSIPILLATLALLVFWRRPCRWRGVLCAILVYFLVANFVGLFVYEWVPAEYTRGQVQSWSWPPDSKSLGMTHGKRLAVAAGTERLSPDQASDTRRSVRREQADFFQRWLGPTLVGLVLVLLVTLISRIFHRPLSGHRMWREQV